MRPNCLIVLDGSAIKAVPAPLYVVGVLKRRWGALDKGCMALRHIGRYGSAGATPSDESIRKLIADDRQRLLCNPTLNCLDVIPFSDDKAIEDAIQRDVICEECLQEYRATKQL